MYNTRAAYRVALKKGATPGEAIKAIVYMLIEETMSGVW